MPGFSVFVTLAAGIAGWVAYRIRLGWLAAAAAVSLAVAAAALAGGVDLTGWGSVLAVVSALSAGSLVGRVLPPRSAPMAVLLIVASMLDVAWIASGGGGPDAIRQVANVTLDVGERSSSIGTLDVLLAAAVAAHGRARHAGPIPAILAAPLGMVLANVYFQASGADNLPLVPFIAVGWALSVAWERLLEMRRTSEPSA